MYCIQVCEYNEQKTVISYAFLVTTKVCAKQQASLYVSYLLFCTNYRLGFAVKVYNHNLVYV